MSLLAAMKVISVFVEQGAATGLHLSQLAAELFAGSSLYFLVFRYLFDKNKAYKNALISTFILLLVLAHDKPYLLGGLLMMTSVYVAKFFIQVKRKSVFNPIVFGIGMVSLLSLLIPGIDTPPATFELLDVRLRIGGCAFPLAFIFILLSLIFNTRRVNRFALALSFICTALVLGFTFPLGADSFIRYALAISFTGTVILVEPKTSPGKMREQLVYGPLMALLVVALLHLNVPNAIFVALWAGNVGYAVYIHQFRKIISPAS